MQNSLFRLDHQFVNQDGDPIGHGRGKYPFGGFIPMGIDIDREEEGIGDQANAANSGQQGLVSAQEKKVFRHGHGLGKIPEIINKHGQQRGDQSDDNAKPEVIFFKYHNFHVFSSLLLRT